MATKSKVLVVGGTGYIGRRIVKASLAHGHETFVLQRPEVGLDIDKLQMLLSFKKQGAHLVEGSFSDHRSLVDAVKKVDVVICTMSGVHFRSHNILLQLKLVDAIKEAGNIKANQSAMMEMVQHDMEHPNKHGGSVVGRKYIRRERKIGHDRLFADYFAQEPIYNGRIFRRRFRMERHLFMTAAIRMLAYGMPADAIDEYVRIGESTAILSLKHFCQSIIDIYEAEYLRAPRPDDVARLLTVGEARGFPGMLGSLDCMHWKWKNCPTAWQGQYSGHIKKPTIILEAVASYDLWIWHAFFGMPGSHNDLNVLDRSPLFSDLAQGRAPPAIYSINGHTYNMGYYLADGIYPPWATLVQTISSPDGPAKQHFADMQEATRKDVERAFGVLQARFAIVRGPARSWDFETLGKIMKTCIILHNMIVEDEREGYPDFEYDAASHNPSIEVSRDFNDDFDSFVSRHIRIRDAATHYAIRNDLIDHLWQRYGNRPL